VIDDGACATGSAIIRSFGIYAVDALPARILKLDVPAGAQTLIDC